MSGDHVLGEDNYGRQFFKKLKDECRVEKDAYLRGDFDGHALRLDIKKLVDASTHYFYRFLSSTYLHFTLVTHPVGGHIDVFADRLPSLENRIIFGFDCGSNISKLKSCETKYGRGGLTNKYTFAILDWSSKNRSNVRWWTHKELQSLPGSRSKYGANQRLTPGIWKIFEPALKKHPLYIASIKV